jgi:hypothetical protein
MCRHLACLGRPRPLRDLVTDPHGEATVAPFSTGRYLFGHDGAVTGWPTSIAALTTRLSAPDLLAMEAVTDSALLRQVGWTCPTGPRPSPRPTGST